MPTAARLVAAVLLGVLAWMVSEQVKLLMPDRSAFGNFNVINLVLGIVIGWQVIGSRCGRGYSAAIGNGLTGGAVLLFWGLLIHAAVEMFERSMRLRYDGAFEAVAAVFELMAEYGLMMATPLVGGTLVVGAILAGFIAEVVDQAVS